ncbi:Coenzyme F420 hydrogenase/dehydrogenase, beta subunit C-terminal domain [[Clostridium] polysaccharolyticum]|uniref:Coenzyme F420-reducing hydrogenase, beta subunit n=1 Tax=[Clostridium] polysaccharolyticum TaxID=29364 RepID=A0A1H9ZEZ6_9FIRM|nr:Coenzyme F420 hydrogenase/dehydrogenase, beta subunit C-terminal domain [[Clostridium] polysaccharolyticum]SES80168.1 Coenzyme F420-reducing hydrogenase, beta subunit [[Clostridium] polysaccharolyticum]
MMKVNLVTSLDRKDVLECLRLWSLQRTLAKRDLEVQILDIEEKTNMGRSEAEAFGELFPNYKRIASRQELEEALEEESLVFVTGVKAWKSRHAGAAKKALMLKGIDIEKYAYNVGMDSSEYGLIEKGPIKKLIQEFKSISVSKPEDQKYLAGLYVKEIPLLCDNTLLLRTNEYNLILKKYNSIRDYILLDTRKKDPKLIELAKKVKRDTGLRVITLDGGFALKHGFQGETIKTSQKFLGVVKGAKYVITDNERSVMFSMIYKRPFLYVNENAEGQEWLAKLLKDVKLKGNMLANADEYQGIEQFKLYNGYALHKRLSEQKKGAYAHLDMLTGVEPKKDEFVDAPTDILKKDCCGCYACAEVCPVTAIQMTPDKRGHYFPVVDKDTCISCGLCKKSCVIQQPRLAGKEETYPKAIAAYHKELDTRKGSTSGAMFPGFARHIIEDKHGYVAGAKYDEDMNVVSDVANTMEGVKAFYGSKYCKSLLDGSYKRIKELLDQGEYVLFSGLPCECSALRAFLRKDYEKLFICEIICHAGPSAKVFKAYVKYLEDKFGSKVTNVTFRQKKNGWQAHQTSMVVEFQDREPLRVVNRSNNYYRIFANDYIARESCTSCRFTYLNRAGDVTIGDFWGIQEIHPEMYDNQGASFVLINNKRGQELWDMAKDEFIWIDSSVEKIFKKNHREPISYKMDSDEFFHRMEKGEDINQLLEEFNDLKK